MKRHTLRLLSTFIAMAIAVSLVSANASTAPVNLALESEYDIYTISFEDAQEMNSPISTLSNEEQNTQNVSSAINYVYSLNLEDAGFGYIEDSCIQQLNEFSQSDGLLTSYSVLVPKAASTLKQFATYNGRTYYYDYYSSYSNEVTSSSTGRRGDDKAMWDDFMNGLRSLMLNFVNWQATLPFTLITTFTGSNYQVKDQAYIASTMVFSATSRGIYTYDDEMKYGSKNELIMLYSDESGIGNPVVKFHPVDPLMEPDYTISDPPIQDIETWEYNQKSVILDVCDTLYNTGRGAPRIWSLKFVVLGMYFE